MTSQRPIRLALIGTGGISGAHVRGILANPDRYEVTAVCSRNPATRAGIVAALGGGTAQFDAWGPMLEQYGDHIDAVDILLPHHLHAQAILDSVAAGKHILCEKPLCRTMEEADRVVEAVDRAGVVLGCMHNQQYFAGNLRAVQLMKEGLLGRVYWVRVNECFVLRPEKLQGAWRSQLDLQGGGQMVDSGVHAAYILLNLALSEPVHVVSALTRLIQPIEGDDAASVAVRFANGALGEITATWSFKRPYGAYRYHVIGEKGQLFGDEVETFHLPEGEKEPRREQHEPASEWPAAFAAFADGVTGEGPGLPDAREARRVLDFVLRASAGMPK